MDLDLADRRITHLHATIAFMTSATWGDDDPAMPNLDCMLNVAFWVETDVDKRAFLYVDSVFSQGVVAMLRGELHRNCRAQRGVARRLRDRAVRCGWAGEAIFFVRTMERVGDLEGVSLRVQISADGIRWCDEGTSVTLGAAEVTFCKVSHFGNWLRLAGRLPDGASMRSVIALSLKA